MYTYIYVHIFPREKAGGSQGVRENVCCLSVCVGSAEEEGGTGSWRRPCVQETKLKKDEMKKNRWRKGKGKCVRVCV